tara:strand:- start:232 stop:666 length:435 start_codon:yes stop_codon:yes gene_type:complete
MFRSITLIISILFLSWLNPAFTSENYFDDAKKKFNEKKIQESKFLFQRNIVFNPKDSKSYLYLAKIFHEEKNQKEELKNLNTALLLEPDNEDAMYMLINFELKKSNYAEVKKLAKNFSIICKKLCEKIKNINEDLKNIEPKDES